MQENESDIVQDLFETLDRIDSLIAKCTTDMKFIIGVLKPLMKSASMEDKIFEKKSLLDLISQGHKFEPLLQDNESLMNKTKDIKEKLKAMSTIESEEVLRITKSINNIVSTHEIIRKEVDGFYRALWTWEKQAGLLK